MNKITSRFVKFVIIASAIFALVPTFAPTPVEAFCAKQVVDPFQLFLKCKKSSSKKAKTPAVTNVSCRVDDTTVGVGDEVVWSASASGGNGTYRYHWRGTENLTGTDQTITKTYTTAGFKFAYVRVYSGDTYSAEIQCSNSPRVRDYDNPDTNSNMRVTCEADDDTVPVNSRVEWTANAFGGKSPYTYEWSGSSGLTGSDKTVSKRYTSNGTKSASVTVTDNSGDQRTVDCGHVVVRDGNEDRLNDNNDDESDNNNNSNSNLGASCYASPTLIQAGETTSWGVAAYGGNGVYSYSWSGTDGVSGNSSYALKSYTTPGTKNASVRVSSNGRSVTVNCAPNVYVNGSISGAIAPSQIPVSGGALNVVCSVNKTSSVVGSSVTWSASVTGGNGQYEYAWSGTDGVTARNSTLTAMYDTVGAKTALVTVRSGDQVVNRACGTVNVTYSAPRPVATGSNTASPTVSGNLQVVCKAQDDSVARGESVIWTAEVKGGNGVYKYSWSGADSLSGDQAVVVKSYNTDGKKFAMVNVSSGRQNVAQACDSVVEVGSFLGAAALLGASWIGAGIFLIFVLFLVIAYVLYNKSKI